MPIAPPPDVENPHRLFIDHRALIDRAIESMARKLPPGERSEFSSWVIEKLLDEDSAVLRKCRNWNHPKTFLASVVGNLYKDFLNHHRGKFRSSKEAQKLGETALQLERLIVRDGYRFSEACEILRTNFKVQATPAELADLAVRLPSRTGRHWEGEEGLRHWPSSEGSPAEHLLAEERQALSERVFEALSRALDALPAEDQALLDYHFTRGWTWAEVARYLRIEQKPLYTRVEKILAGLRQSLEAEGCDGESLREVLQGAGLVFRLRKRRKSKGSPSPS